MKNILVIGGAGFIGSHVAVELIGAGYRPVIVDNFSNSTAAAIERLEKLTGQTLAHYEQDYQDLDKLRDIFEKEKIDGIIHFAASKYVGESVAEPLRYYQNNVAGFVGLLEAVLAAGIHQFVFSSSAAVYGNPPVSKVTEETVCSPLSPYGWSKRMDEIILHDTCRANPDLRGVALRYFNVVGAHKSGQIGDAPKLAPQNLAQVLVRAASSAGELTVNGNDYPTADGTCERDYIHVVDLAKAHVAALKHIEATAKPNYNDYCIGTGKPSSVLDIIKAFEKVSGIKVPYKFGPRRAGDPVTYFAIPDKANQELGWKAENTIEDAMRDAWAWQQQLVKLEK